jgi:hypothetical protein
MSRDLINFDADEDIRSRLALLKAKTGIDNMASVIRNLIITQSDQLGYQKPPCPDQDGPALTNRQ